MRPLILAFIVLNIAALSAAEPRSLAKASFDGAQLELTQTAGAKLALTLGNSPAQTLTLQTPGWGDSPDADALRKDKPLTASAFALPGGANGAWVDFGLDNGAGGVRAVTVLLVRGSPPANWSVAREWFADSAALGEMGYKREKQSFATDAGKITRTLRSYSVEGVTHKLDCGCTACSSRATDIEEIEVIEWNASTHAFDPKKHEKWYFAQPGENLLAAVRKALGDARRVNRVAKLNPQLLDGSTFKGGERILMQREQK